MQYIIGDWSVSPKENKLLNKKTNELIHLAPKSMSVLMCFAQNPGQVFSIDSLVEKIWVGRVVSDHAVYRVITQLRKTLNPEDKNAYLINIPKKGYQLIQPVTVSEEEVKTVNKQLVRRKKPTLKLLAFTLALLTSVCALYFLQLNNTEPSIPLYKNAQPFTTEVGNETDPHFSVDGKYMAYSKQVSKNTPFNIHILDVEKQTEVQITDHGSNAHQPVISQNADRLVYIKRDKGLCQVVLIDNPLLDNNKEIPLFDCDWQNMDLEISNDGKTLFFTQSTAPNNQHKIFYQNIDTGKAIQLTTIKAVNSQGDRIISLSPDNKKLAFFRDSDWKWSTLGVLDLTEYTEDLYLQTGGWVNGLAWTPDSQHIIYQNSYRSLALFSPEDGKSRKITSDFTEDILAISHHANNSDLAIAFGSKEGGIIVKSNPLLVSQDNTSEMIQSTEVDSFPSFSNLSKQMAFMSKRTGNAQIWLRSEQGENIQLTNYQDARSVRTMRWSPNDKALLTETQNSISYINIEDKSVHNLIIDGSYGSVGGATWNKEGTGIYFSSDISGDSQIYHLMNETKDIKQITQSGAIMAFATESADILYLLKPYKSGLWKYNVTTGEETLEVKEINSQLHRSIHLTDKGIYYASTQGIIYFYAFDNQTTTELDIQSKLMVPILTVSHDERLFAFPHYNKSETSIFLLKQ